MRLSEEEIEIIQKSTREFFAAASVYLFGSRLVDTKKGGDIDLFVITEEPVDLERKLRFKSKLHALLHKPVDVVFHKDYSRTIEQEAMAGVQIVS